MATFPPSSKITEEEWDRNKSLIIALYLGTDHKEIECVEASEGQVKGKTLDEVAKSMKGYGFNASVSQFEAKLNAWGARKNLKPEEWEQIHKRLEKLPRTTKSRVLISGRVVADAKIKRARRYRTQKSRAANSMPTSGSSNFSALSHHVHIEVQESNGRWISLLNTNNSRTPTASSPLRLATFGDNSAADLPVSSLIPVISTSLRSPIENSYHPFDSDGTSDESTQEYPLECPTTWLGSLLSIRIINAVRECVLDHIDCTENRAQTRAMFTGMIDWSSAISYSRISDASLQFPNTIACQNFGTQNEQNRRIMAPADTCRSKFSYFMLSVIMNGKCEVDQIPAEVLDGLLGPDGAVNSLLLQCFTDAPYLFKLIISTLLGALVFQRKRDTIAQLLEKRLVHADDDVIINRKGDARRRYTLLEAAAVEGDEGLVELLLSYGGDPNKTYQADPNKPYYGPGYGRGALYCITHKFGLMHDPKGRTKEPPSFKILQKLFEAGAEVRPSRFMLGDLDKASTSLVILQIKQSQHEEYFKLSLWDIILQKAEDVHAADLFSRFVSDCEERHDKRCLSCYQKDVDGSLVLAAQLGRTKTFLAMSPHSSQTSDLNEQLLSAAIEGGQSMIINSVMLRGPNINPRPHRLYSLEHISDGFGAGGPTTPLAQSIRTKNSELVDCFADAGIFESLHEGGRFETALNAAAEVGDANLVTRLLRSCPDLGSQSMELALYEAIDNGHDDIADLLLEKGASAYTNEVYSRAYPMYLDQLTILAVRKGSKRIAQKLLSIGDKTATESFIRHSRSYDEEGFQRLLYLMDPDIRKDYLLSYPCSFRYKIFVDLRNSISNFIPRLGDFHQDIYDHLVATREGKSNCDLILDSKLATVQLLTACLAIAISRSNLTLAKRLIERGANASHETVLTCALRWGATGATQLLLHSMNHQRPVMTKGLRTEVLKAAIEQGPDKYDLVRQLIESRLVDILDTGTAPHHADDISTPLGVAIRTANTEFPQNFSHDVTRLLLDHGCGAENIVRFEGSLCLPTNHTAILEAIDARSQELVKLLIKYGADINPELRYLVRRTPLQKAAEKGDLSMVRLLLQYGADVNAKPAIAMGGTALQFAAISGNCEVVCELLSRGALLCTSPPKIGGRWPIEGAAEHGRIEMIQFLWKAKEETLLLGYGDNGFQKKNFIKAMRLARDNQHYECVELIAQLANLPVTATDVPPVVSPMYIDWPPPERTVD
ncbi:hypothetical protein FHL15_002838 [Xylaria flabelliformis]|uniref:Clr5 domain-containing protein n=1 Tax=Xylaria flabelliformis TaxID=2512241 RepID=A0A553I7G1_9PEZI|nr:hypothetical protein FHL15_002838 [Xylaria flabelliformis]